jgi:hypothetical protein
VKETLRSALERSSFDEDEQLSILDTFYSHKVPNIELITLTVIKSTNIVLIHRNLNVTYSSAYLNMLVVIV